MVIISFLPLGFTISGKVFIVLVSFVLALGGLAAISSFPLWETVLLLVLLIFFTAYFMGKRGGTVIFKENPSFEERLPSQNTNTLLNSKIDMIKMKESMELTELDLVEAPVINMADTSQPIVKPTMEKLIENKEDILFLLERNSVSEAFEQKQEESENEIGYLSDIESLLEEEISNRDEKLTGNWFEEMDDLIPLDEEVESHVQHIPNEIEPFGDSSFDFLNASKEIAVDIDSVQEETETKKKVTLQKIM
jgi:hypothetical protein